MPVNRVRRATAVASVTLACAGLVTAATADVARAQTAAVPAGLVPVVTRHSLLGTHTWYRQTFHGLPVLDSFYAVHTDSTGRVTAVDDGRLAVPASFDTVATVTSTGAVGAARPAVAAKAATASKAAAGRAAKNSTPVPAFGTGAGTLAVVGGAHPALVWDVVATSDDGATETRVDAHTGAVVAVKVLTKNAGSGTVFNPNPVVSQRDQSLTDRGDRDIAVPAAAYSTVTLAHLGAGTTLGGSWARIARASVPVATSATRTYSYQRSDDRFEQVNAYYGVDLTQTYIQSLGFTDVNHEAQKLVIDTAAVDNSFYNPTNDTITYGTGGVDDAEDLEVVWHEYGHAIQADQVPDFGGSSQAGAIGEGFGDYWAVTMSQPTGGGYDVPCVMDWDSTAYTSRAPHCLRRTDTGKTTADIDGEVHDDGEIWSNALYDINRALGRATANTIILESQFSYAPNTSFAAAAQEVVATAKSLSGTAAAAKVRQAFVARKIL